MRLVIAVSVLPWLWTTASAPAAEGERALGAHLHGHGTVNIAIDEGAVWIELEAPGSDIVGFEHTARTEADRAAVAAARALLERPAELFVLPAAAGCSVEAVDVALAGGEDGGDHSEFRAEYRLACADAARIDAIEFAYFRHFPAAQALEVTVVTATRQGRYDVGRDDPAIRLEGD